MNINIIIPERIRSYIEYHTKPNSKLRNELVELIARIMRGERVRYKEIKSKSIKYHVDRMKRLNLLVTIRSNGVSYIAINPDILKNT